MPSGSPPVASIGALVFDHSPASDGVEPFERQADRIDHVVTPRAGRVGPMLREPLPAGQTAVHGVVLERRHVGQRWRRRHAEQVVEHPLAANHRRRPGRVRRDGQDAALPQQSAAPAVVGQRDAPETVAVHVRDTVVLRQPFVDERVFRVQQIENAAVLAQHAVHEQLGLAPEGLPQVVVEVRKQAHVGRHRVEIAQVQPLRREVRHERARPFVGEHAPHLLLEHGGLSQLPRRGHRNQLVVWNAAPQEERQARGERKVADAIRRVRRKAGRIRLDAEQELRAHEHAGERHLDTRVEIRVCTSALVERHRPLEIGLGHRPAVGPPRERPDNLPRGAVLVDRACGTRNEKPPAAWRVAGPLRIERAEDGHGIDRRLDPRVAVGIEVCLVRLPRRLDQIRRFLDERDAEDVRSRGHGNADVEVRVGLLAVSEWASDWVSDWAPQAEWASR